MGHTAIRIILFSLSFVFLWPSLTLAERPLKVRVAIPLTGVGAAYGEAYKNGLLSGLNKAGGSIDLTFEDHRYDNITAISILRKFAMQDDPDVVIVWGYAPSDAVAPIVPSMKFPVFLSSLNPVGKGQPRILNLSSPIARTLAPLVSYLEEQHYKSIAIASSQIGSLEQSASVIEKALPSVSITRESFLPSDTDFRSFIAKVRTSSSEAIGLLLAPAQIKAFADQARSQKANLSFFGIDTFNDSSVHASFDVYPVGPVFLDAHVDELFRGEYLSNFGKSSHLSEAARGNLHSSLLMHIQRSSTPDYTPDSIVRSFRSFAAGTGPSGDHRVVDDQDFGLYLDVAQKLYKIEKGQVGLYKRKALDDLSS